MYYCIFVNGEYFADVLISSNPTFKTLRKKILSEKKIKKLLKDKEFSIIMHGLAQKVEINVKEI